VNKHANSLILTCWSTTHTRAQTRTHILSLSHAHIHTHFPYIMRCWQTSHMDMHAGRFERDAFDTGARNHMNIHKVPMAGWPFQKRIIACVTHEWVMSHMNESCTYLWGMLHDSNITLEACYTYIWVRDSFRCDIFFYMWHVLSYVTCLYRGSLLQIRQFNLKFVQHLAFLCMCCVCCTFCVCEC